MIQWTDKLPALSGSYNTWGPSHGDRKVVVWAWDKAKLVFVLGIGNESAVGVPLLLAREKLGIEQWLGPIAEPWDLWPEIS